MNGCWRTSSGGQSDIFDEKTFLNVKMGQKSVKKVENATQAYTGSHEVSKYTRQ